MRGIGRRTAPGAGSARSAGAAAVSYTHLAQDLHDGLKALAEGPSKEYIQLLYLVNNSLEELPAEFRNMKRLSMLDLTQNRLRVLHPLGSEVAPVQLFLDNNQLEEIPTDENGIFCNIADMRCV